jgi:hypothetical protein
MENILIEITAILIILGEEDKIEVLLEVVVEEIQEEEDQQVDMLVLILIITMWIVFHINPNNYNLYYIYFFF